MQAVRLLVVLAVGASCARSSFERAVASRSLSNSELAAINETQRQLDEERRRCQRLRDETPSPEQVRAVSDSLTRHWFDGGTLPAPPRLDRVVARLDAGVSVQVVAAASPETFSTFPNGVFVTSALLETVTSDDALSGFVAHELGHLDQGDLTRLAQREAVWRCESDVTVRQTAGMSERSGLNGELGRLAAQLDAGSRLPDLAFRTDLFAGSFRLMGFGESQADALAREQSADERALKRLHSARIDAGPWAAAIQASLTAGHPTSPAREKALARAKETLPPLPPEPPRKRSKASK